MHQPLSEQAMQQLEALDYTALSHPALVPCQKVCLAEKHRG